MSTEHTPTPWHVCAGNVYRLQPGKSGTAIAKMDRLEPDTSYDERQANADFIVKAVNNHDALVEALKESLNEMEMFRAYWRSPNMGVTRSKCRAEELCEKVLALIEKGQP